jgi:hypothetical protein
MKVLIGGKKYTREELLVLQAQLFQDLKDGNLKDSWGDNGLGAAIATDKNTYQFSLERAGYGRNMITACSEDDGGRIACDTVNFNLSGDSKISIEAPTAQVLPLGATVTIETSSEVGSGTQPKVLLHGLNGQYGQYLDENAPQMMQVARNGNTYTHHYMWKPREEGYYTFRAVLFENGIDTNTQSLKGLLIVEPRVIKILSLTNGQECNESKPCSVSVSDRDVKGNIVRDKLELLVDGKSFGTIHSLECGECEPRSLSLRSARFDKGQHSLQVVARHETGIELGRSEVYIFTIK